MYDNLIYLANVILGIIGFSIALNICCKKMLQKPLVCPLNMKCDQVIYSKYAKFLGIPVDFLGMFYYGIIVISYSTFLFLPATRTPSSILTISIITISGFLFSIYLTSVQIFKLKEWCSWCLTSAAISTAMAILISQTSYLAKNITYLAEGYRDIFIVGHSLAISFGFSVAIIGELLFIHFLKDNRVSDEESFVLHTIRQITWLAIGILIISSFVIKPNFLTVILPLGLLTIVSLVYDLFVSSRLTELFSGRNPKPCLGDKYLKRVSLVFGPIFLILWIVIFVLQIIK